MTWKKHALFNSIAMVVAFVQLPFAHVQTLGQENPECGSYEMLWGIYVEGVSQREFFGRMQHGRFRDGWHWGFQ